MHHGNQKQHYNITTWYDHQFYCNKYTNYGSEFRKINIT